MGLASRTISPSIVTTALYPYAHDGRIIKSINTLVHQKTKEGFKMKAKLMGLFKDEAGQAMTEYGLIIALIAIVVIVGLTAMSGQLNTLFQSIKTALTPAA